jgi:superfamily II RNA helicase
VPTSTSENASQNLSSTAAQLATGDPLPHPPLQARVPAGGTTDSDEILDLFLGWVADVGFELYPAQEEALLEIMAGRHVILNTPTGSGKSLVALGMHFKAMCEGKKCFYTSPIKALASEKFFALCEELGAENVGMQTGDASINPEASIICCTAEVLSNRALRQGDATGADYVVMDEFHYYGDPDRGVAWQVPLITLPRTTFLLMSATLGNTAPIAERLEDFTRRKVSLVYSEDRPVPLDFEYRETPLHETVEYLMETRRAPIYIVNFTQRECAELAQSLTSVQLCSREERKEIKKAIGDFRWDTPYGKDMRRFLGFGVGVHHAGLLPKYRLLVEQLAQQGLLKAICGTDTLGVGVNIPIRTVLFTKLSKFDGEKISLLRVRDFKQIAGRAGRKGFDDRGSVVCQAPEHVIETRRQSEKDRRKRKKTKRPPPGFVSWNQDTFEKLISRPPEMLKSRFRITHGMVLNLLQRDAEEDVPERDNFDSLRELIRRCHERKGKKRKLMTEAAVLVRSLNRADIIKMERDQKTEYRWAVVNDELQWDFSLFQALSLYLVEALEVLDPEDPEYTLDVVSLVEAILENPKAVLYRQVDNLKGELIRRLKADGVPYEERMDRLDEVTYPKPSLELIEETFAAFRKIHPWVRGEDIRPKSIGREMFEDYYSFQEYVRHYGLQRSEGVLLRYLSQLYKTLSQTVPERAKTQEVYDVVGFFGTMIEHTDTSLLEEWESMIHPELKLDREREKEARREMRAYELLHDPKALPARVRAELHQLVRVLSERDYDEAAQSVWQGPPESEYHWPAERFAEALAPFFGEYGELVFNHEARKSQHTRLKQTGPRTWEASQVLVDPEGDNFWYVDALVDLSDPEGFEGPLLRIRRIGE